MTLPRRVVDVGWIASFLGADIESVQKIGELAGIDLIAITGPKEPFVVIMSAGLADVQVEALAPQEVLVTVQRDQWEGGLILLTAALEVVLDRGRALAFDDVLANAEPFLQGTEIVGLLADVNPWLDSEATTRRDDRGQLQTVFVTLIPLLPSELDAFARSAPDERGRVLEQMDDRDLLNLRRHQ